jgi:peptidoglycan-N-acetylglucosamine deacetylase
MVTKVFKGNPPRRWMPSTGLWSSLGLHCAAGAATVLQPSLWPIALGVVVANHGVLTAAGLWPKSRLLGPNLCALPPVQAARGWVGLTFDDGPDPQVTPWVLDQLDAYSMTATFFVVGNRLRGDQDAISLAREVVRRGHLIENHSDQHSNAFSFYGMKRLGSDIDAAQQTIADVAGRMPQLFRAPAGLRNPLLEPVLASRGLTLTSWTHRGLDTYEKDANVVFERLSKNIEPGNIFMLHDGSCRGDGGAVALLERPIYTALPRLLTRLKSIKLTGTSIRLDA